MGKERLHYIDGYKGLLCFLILLGHFWNIYRLTSGVSPLDLAALDTVTRIAEHLRVIKATFWLYAFMIISGYLLSFSSIKSAKDLLTKTATRFLRLFIPILGASAIIFLIYKTVGFHANETGAYFKNTWFQKYYVEPFAWTDIFTQSLSAVFKGDSSFNPPFWVIRDMLMASGLIYICKLVESLFGRKMHGLPLVFTLCALLTDNQVVTACFAGFFIGYYKDGLAVLTKSFLNFLCVFAAICGVFLWLKVKETLPTVIDDITGYILIHCFLVITLNRFAIPQRIFSSKLFLFAGEISFGVYSFHWPVICSVGSLTLMVGLERQWHPALTLWGSFTVSVVCTIILSVIYHYTVEKFSEAVIRGVRKLVARLPE